MKTIKKNFAKMAILCLFAGAFMVSCSSPKTMSSALQKVKLKADPQNLEVKGDSITVKITGRFPAKMFAKNASVKIQPILRFGNQKKLLATKYFVGEKLNARSGATRIDFKKGGAFTYYQRVEYTPEMKNSMLTIDYTVKFISKNEEQNKYASGTLKDSILGTVTTELSVKASDNLFFFDDATPGAGFRRVTFYYAINEGFLRDSAINGPAVKALDTLAADPRFKIANISLKSYASPDGKLDGNAQLTRERAESTYKAVKDILESKHVTIENNGEIVKTPDENGEDWAGLKNLVSGSDFEGKADVMTVINNNMSFDEKNASLKSLACWNNLKDNYLPRLRRTEVVIGGTIPNRSVAEVSSMATSSFDGLTKQEIIEYANNTTNNASKEKAYKYLMDKYPGEWAGVSNYATVLLKEGQYQFADSLLAIAHKQWPDNDTIANNLGVADREMHKYDEAKAMYAEAAAKNMDESNNLGILYIQMGDYDNALASFGPKQCDYNVALTYTLKNDFDNALSKIDGIADKTPEVYYLKAITAARKGDAPMMDQSLAEAVKGDEAYRDQAKTDFEFKKYWNKAEFQNVTIKNNSVQKPGAQLWGRTTQRRKRVTI